MRSESIELLAAALVKAQAEFPSVKKDSENPFFKSKYADLSSVVKAAAPVITKHGLAISQWVTHEGGSSLLRTYLLHESGQHICHEMPLLLNKQDAQSQGSAISYARRYSYMSVLGLVADDDDDGNRASQPAKSKMINPAKLNEVRERMVKQGLIGEAATSFVTSVIGKDKPDSPEDVDKLAAALADEPF